MKHNLVPLISLIFFLVLFAFTNAQESDSSSEFTTNQELEPLSPLQELILNDVGYSFIEAFATIRELYLEDIEDDVILEGAIEGMINALDDPYSYYLEPLDAEVHNENITGSYSGIGINLSSRSRDDATTIEVTRINSKGPAKREGLRRGDVFKKIDNKDVTEMNLDEMARLLRGEEGTAVVLEMYRPSVDELLRFVIVREVIDIVDIESTMLPNNIGYINLLSFYNIQIADDFTETYNELLAQGIDALIIDLRDNSGGFLYQARDIADLFLDDGAIYWERRAEGLTGTYAKAEETDNTSLPIVLLVNSQTASASEIFALALEENDRVYIIGEKTFGKGVASEYYSFRNEGAVQLTIEEWLSPDQNSVTEVGLEPHLLVKDSRYPQVLDMVGTGAIPGQTMTLTLEDGTAFEIEVDEDGYFTFTESIDFLEYIPEEITGNATVDLVGDAILSEAIVYLQSLKQ